MFCHSECLPVGLKIDLDHPISDIKLFNNKRTPTNRVIPGQVNALSSPGFTPIILSKINIMKQEWKLKSRTVHYERLLQGQMNLQTKKKNS